MKTPAPTIKKQVRDLVSGDDLGNCVIISNHYVGTVMGQKNRHYVKVRWAASGKETTQIWGRFTTVSVTKTI